jgi:phytoene dehydrogenase-like protein
VAQYFDPEMDNIPENHEAIATSVARAIEQMAPGFAETVVDYAVYIGDDLDKTIGPLSRDSFHGNAPLNQVFAGHFGHHALGVSVPMQNLTLCGYGPEASAGSHTNNGGLQAAERILSLMNRSLMRGTG